LSNNPIPFIPFPLSRGRGIDYKRETEFLFDSLPIISGCIRGAEPLLSIFSLSPSKERGIKGVRLIKNSAIIKLYIVS